MRFRTKFVPLFLEGVVVRRQSKCGRDILRGAGGASQHTVTTLQQCKTNTDRYLLLGALHMSWHGGTARHRSLW
jgi:hypothetical protein